MMNRIQYFVLAVLVCLNLQAAPALANATEQTGRVAEIDLPVLRILPVMPGLSGLTGSTDEIADDTFSETHSMVGVQTTITGKVQFEPRYTRVIEMDCEDFPCSRSKVYWVMVVKSGETTYLLNQKINDGTATAPEAFELAGVVLRDGVMVQVDAQVVQSTPAFSVMININGISVLSDRS